MKEEWLGTGEVLLACSIWGLAPILYKNFSGVDLYSMLIFRSCFTLLTAIITVVFKSQVYSLFLCMKNSRKFLFTLGTAFIIGIDWSIYLWSIPNGKVVEATIGCFLSPIVCIAIGHFRFSEVLNRRTSWAIFLSLIGVLFLVFDLSHFPWVTLVVTLTSTMIATLRKLNPSDALTSTTLESFFLSIFFVAIGTVTQAQVTSIGRDVSTIWLTGLVTFFPAYLYSQGAKKVKISSLGMLGLSRPIIRFLVAIVVLQEALSVNQILSVTCIFLSFCCYFLKVSDFLPLKRYSTGFN